MTDQLILKYDEDTFDEQVARTPGPILVEFWASWCQPCKVIAARLEELASELAGQVRIAKINVEENGDLANRFGVRNVPTLIVFKNGKVVDQLIGAAPTGQIRKMLNRHIDPPEGS